jgi:fermentation-respiration switch protein FrsA (DUF1100 family)
MATLSLLGKIALGVALLYLAFATLVFLLQRQLLYFPSAARPHPVSLAASNLTYWPADDEAYRGFITPETGASATGTIIAFHGNAGTAAQRSFYAEALVPLGYRVLLAEYPGYGGRPGAPSERVIVDDAKETLALAYATFGPPIYLWGESLGAGVAAAVAADPSVPIAGLALITPWDALPEVAQAHYPFFPARWLTLDKFNSVRNLAGYDGPVAVILAGRDEVVPTHHGQRLYDSLSKPKRRWIFDDAGHNDWPISATESWWREVVSFVRSAQ